MKNLLFKSFIILSVILVSSCSSSGEDDPVEEANTIRMTINGNVVVFDENEITVNTTTNGGVNGGPTVTITGAIDNLNSQIVNITLATGSTGSNSLEAFEYFDSPAGINTQYIPALNGPSQCGSNTITDSGNFVTNTNNDSMASGSFSLNIQECVNGTVQNITITNGSFNVSY